MRFIVVGGGVVLLVIVLGLFFQTRGSSTTKASAIQMSPVVVALQTIPNGTTFTSGQPLATFFGVRQVPTSMVPFGAYNSVDQINTLIKSSGCVPSKLVACQGKLTTTQTIYQNLPVVTGMFSTLGQFRQTAGGSFSIPYGYVGIGVGFTDVNSVLGSIQPGDDVDLIASYTGPEAGDTNNLKQTQYVLNDVRVIAVNGPIAPPSSSSSKSSSETSNASGGSLLLMVRYQQALVIQHLKDFGGSWTLSCVLRSAKETDIPHFRTLPVTGKWFFVKQENHFDMKAPY
jgi:Flp pilus assembly protein CpaB